MRWRPAPAEIRKIGAGNHPARSRSCKRLLKRYHLDFGGHNTYPSGADFQTATTQGSNPFELSVKQGCISGSISACSGKEFSVDKGQVFRIVQIEGPQIGDLWYLNRDDTSEHFLGHTTFLHEGAYPGQFSQFRSCMPQVRPMATMLLEHSGRPELRENFHNHACSVVIAPAGSGKC